jgi:hypothetical protein
MRTALQVASTLVLGLLFLVLLTGIASTFGMSGWAFAHSGLVLLAALLALALAYFVVRFFSARMSKPSGEAPNPSIERTATGKPVPAAHVER